MKDLELSDEQVISLVRHLPPERKREALFALAQDARGKREHRLLFGESQLRRIAAQRGLNWDVLPEAGREALVDDLLHGR